MSYFPTFFLHILLDIAYLQFFCHPGKYNTGLNAILSDRSCYVTDPACIDCAAVTPGGVMELKEFPVMIVQSTHFC